MATAPSSSRPNRTLSPHGSRAAERIAKAEATVKARTAAEAASTRVKPPAPARTIVVCVPDDLSTSVLDSARNLQRHLGVSGTAETRFWASPTLHLWQRGKLIRFRSGRPAWCAGGEVRLLNLAGMRDAAAVGANIRHQQWYGAVSGTRPATPWQVFHERHLSDPDRYPMATAVAEFEEQPRITAMRLHNAANPAGRHLDPHEVEIFQAGAAAYANFHRMWTVVTDAFLTREGVRWQPASGYLTDWVPYLQQANQYVDRLDATERLLAITL